MFRTLSLIADRFKMNPVDVAKLERFELAFVIASYEVVSEEEKKAADAAKPSRRR